MAFYLNASKNLTAPIPNAIPAYSTFPCININTPIPPAAAA